MAVLVASTLGSRIRAARLTRKLNQEQLGKRVGLSDSYVSQIESGNRRPTPETLKALCDELGLDYREMSALLVDLPPAKGDEIIEAPRDIAPYIRRLLHYPADVWAALETTAGAWATRRPKPPQGPANHDTEGSDQERPE